MSSSPVINITSKQVFDDLVKSHPYVVLQAHATWCGPCKAISPIFNKIATEHAGLSDKFAFARFDTDDVPDLAFDLGIRSIPAFFSFENGDKGEGLTGASPPALKKLLDGIAAKAQDSGASNTAAAAADAVPEAAAAKDDNKLVTDENF